MSWKKSERLMDTIRHYASFPATGVSLRQMVQFGEKPSTGEHAHSPSPALPVQALILTLAACQAPCSVPRSSSPRSFPYASPTASKSSRPCPTGSTRCRQSRKWRIGMHSRLRYATPPAVLKTCVTHQDPI